MKERSKQSLLPGCSEISRKRNQADKAEAGPEIQGEKYIFVLFDYLLSTNHCLADVFSYIRYCTNKIPYNGAITALDW